MFAVTTCLPARSAASTASPGDAVGAADQLDEHVDARIGRQRHRIVEPPEAVEIDAAVLARLRADTPAILMLAPARSRQPLRLVLRAVRCRAGADGAKAGDAQG